MTDTQTNGYIAQVRVAVMTLTRLPAGSIADPVPSMADARWAYPLVGVLVGALVGASVSSAAWIGLPPLVSAILGVTVGLFITGAMHEDGLADSADGFWGGRDRERKLEIMRDSRIGTYGTLALIVSVAARTAAIAALASPFWSILGVAVLSRFAMVVAIERMAPARSNGLGAAAGDGPSQLVVAAALASVGVVALAAVAHAGVLLVLLAMLVAGFAMARTAQRHINGQTGDVLGAVQQITEIAGLVALSALAI